MQFDAEHEELRRSVRAVLEREILPNIDEWERAGAFPAHELFKKLGDAGILGLEYHPAYGGQGADHLCTAILGEELGRLNAAGVAMAISVQTDMATPALHRFGSERLKQKYLVPAISGDAVTSIAVTEPNAGSDVAALTTRAVLDGDEWVINGTKTFITTGTQSDWVCLLARTSGSGGYAGMSQIVVPTDTPGLNVSRKLDKLGNRSSDTAELVFADARVPVDNVIGEVGRGFQQQMAQFQNERMIVVYTAVGAMESALDRTASYLAERHAFGGPLLDKQYVQFRLAELSADVEMLRHYAYASVAAHMRGEDTTQFATIAKFKAGRLSREVADWCLQFHGGIGYMEDNWTARYFRDARLVAIGGGAEEIMLRTIARMNGWGS